MKIMIHGFFKPCLLMAVVLTLLVSCNKELPSASPIVTPVPTGATIAATIKTDPDLTILKAALARAGTPLSALLSDSSGVYTFFAPTDAAFQRLFQALGIPAGVGVAAFRPGQLDTVLRYHLIGGQALNSTLVPGSFPNVQEPSAFVLAPPSSSLPPGLRMSIFPGKNGSAFFVNNIPVIQADLAVSNGIIHKIAAVALPPSQYLWNRIDTAADLTYLRAAILRADSGSTAATSLQAALLNPAANLTVFAPTNTAFQQLLTAQITMALIPMVTQQLIQGGATPDQAAAQAPTLAQAQATTLASTPGVFQNPLLFGAIPAQTVKGLVVYHLLGVRAFTVNFPPTLTYVPTLLNTVIASHPGVGLQASFGPAGVTAATVKGVANATASNLLINPYPGGTSDQLYINGILHKIDQVLRPQ
ncbi:MAG: fasciclin domain-containing protein [Flavisolibacter sp.]